MDQIAKLIANLSITHRISIVAAALLVVGGLFGFVHYRRESDFRPLYTSMAAEDAATVVQKLKESGVEYRLSDNGSSVLVPSAKLAESRLTLAAAGLPKSGRIGFELFDKTNFGATEFVEHINYQRALEGELERSVMSLAEVEQARVHITLAKESVFLDQQQPAKASVMVKLRPAARISQANVLAVTNLVASAVEGLNPDAVSLVDMNGALLTRPKRTGTADPAQMSGESLEVRQRVESNLVAKISETLEPLLGANGFRAGVSIDFDPTSGEQQEEVFDPEHSVMLSSQKTEDVTGHVITGGIPGSASNLPPTGNGAAKTGSDGLSRRTENVTYQTSHSVRRTTIPQGVIRRMSLAVLVGQSMHWEGAGANKRRVLTPPPPETLKTIRELVAGVSGLDEKRGDQLIVETLPFESALTSEPPPEVAPPAKPVNDPAWLQFVNRYRALWTPAALAVVALMVVVRMFVRRRKKSAIESEIEMAERLQSGATITGLPAPDSAIVPRAALEEHNAREQAIENDNRLAERVRELARAEPAITANVLRMWLQESKTSQSTS